MAITIIIWALSYFPRDEAISARYTQQTEQAATVEQQQVLANEAAGEQLRNSYFARIGHAVEPAFEPLGWDWRVTMAALAAFPAREVIIATLGTIFNLGSDVDEESGSLIEKMRQAQWESGARMGQPLFTPAVALSVMIFFALCCQCGATLVTIRKETQSWRYPVFVFLYMTSLAYVMALVTYQVFSKVWY
jgi:ferrous iron transport protein B